MTKDFKIIDVTLQNVDKYGIYCIKNKKSKGWKNKVKWFKNKMNQGIKIKIAVNQKGKQLGFIEYMPSEIAWRPVIAKDFYFIQCLVIFSKKDKNKQIGQTLVEYCENDAEKNNKAGICTMTSKGTWIPNKSLFEKLNYEISHKRGRFELMFKKLNENAKFPQLNDWTKAQNQYEGWNLLYADQCPMYVKSVTDIKNFAEENNINLKVIKIDSPQAAQNGPSGFGTYALLKDGKLLSDHYISKTRFKNILKKEK